MNLVTKGIYPEKVLGFFEEISKIPRGSGKEKQISDWLVKFAKDRNLEVYQDSVNNVIIKKEATKGYEKYAPLILQGHMDMVWEKNKDVDFDFEKEGIKLKIEDGYLKAKGTTLGADNGIAIAYGLAILDSDDIKHPKLEILITTDEEVSMTGAQNLDMSLLEGKKMINLDTEEVGKIYVSSAGGATIKLRSKVETLNLDKEDKVYLIEILGLQGGHSGAEIHLNLGNSIKILSEVLKHLNIKYDFELIEIDGGNKDNAIPREAHATIATKVDLKDINEVLELYISLKKDEFKNEPALKY